MTPEQFVYWMQGFAELNEAPPSPEQWKSIREHLSLVFEKKTHAFNSLAGRQGPLTKDQLEFVQRFGAARTEC